MFRPLAVFFCLLGARMALPAQADSTKTMLSSDYSVIEFRRYTIKEGQREHFAKRFESYFREAIQQTGAIIAAEFLERANSNMFTWIRLNAALYYGPVWKEHRSQMNDLLLDSDNVLLLHPLDPQRCVAILPAVDLAQEMDGAQGIVVAQIFKLKPDSLKTFPQQAESAFASYRAAGVREAGVLVTLDVPNNFPQLPIRIDGPYLVRLGILKDNDTLERRFAPLAQEAASSLSATGLPGGAVE